MRKRGVPRVELKASPKPPIIEAAIVIFSALHNSV